ncbi:MAG TPA: protease pro-enzyme activation domain-containing protein [Steroidobacteraceae bacterium]|nr:protease pro-enzyme activation domain-containing protein [Steroidobacteraceae bacterium]
MAKKKRPAQNRTVKPPKGYAKVPGSERRPATGARLIGPAAPRSTLSVTIRLRRRRDSPPLARCKALVETPPSDRQYLSRADFAQAYGASKSDVEKVIRFVEANRLKVKEISSARRAIVVSGRVSDMERAFAVKLNRYRTPVQSYRGREGCIHLPKVLRPIVTGVFGLDNRRMAHRASTPAGKGAITPPKVAALYEFPTPADATGQTIGIIEFGGGIVIDPMTGRMPDLDASFAKLKIPISRPPTFVGRPRMMGG